MPARSNESRRSTWGSGRAAVGGVAAWTSVLCSSTALFMLNPLQLLKGRATAITLAPA